MSNNIGKGAIKRTITVRKFNHAWLNEDIFRGWLAPHPKENKALCVACNQTIRCCKTDLRQHSQTVTHINNIKRQTQSLDKSNQHNLNELTYKDKVKRAEIKLATFFTEHNVAFYNVEHLVPLIKDICIEPKIAQDLTLG